eukprot:3823680-Rhodomonas_salina.1
MPTLEEEGEEVLDARGPRQDEALDPIMARQTWVQAARACRCAADHNYPHDDRSSPGQAVDRAEPPSHPEDPTVVLRPAAATDRSVAMADAPSQMTADDLR